MSVIIKPQEIRASKSPKVDRSGWAKTKGVAIYVTSWSIQQEYEMAPPKRQVLFEAYKAIIKSSIVNNNIYKKELQMNFLGYHTLMFGRCGNRVKLVVHKTETSFWNTRRIAAQREMKE